MLKNKKFIMLQLQRELKMNKQKKGKNGGKITMLI